LRVQSSVKKSNKTLYIILLVVGVFLLLFGILSLLANINFLNKASKTTGTIVGFHTINSFGSKAPVFQFVTEDGKTLKVNSDSTAFFETYQINQKIDILYDKKNPLVANIDSFMQIWSFTILIFIVFDIFIFFGVRGLYNIRENKNFRKNHP